MMKTIQITARREGFRRCGIAHSAKPTVYEAGHFTKEQLAELTREPNLIVVELSEQESADSTEQITHLQSENKRLAELLDEAARKNSECVENIARLETENTALLAKVEELTETGVKAPDSTKKGKQ